MNSVNPKSGAQSSILPFPNHPRDNRLPEIRSEEYKEVLATPPPLLLRLGPLAVLAFIGLLVLVAVVVPYPETVHVQVNIATAELPVNVVAPASGQIASLNVDDGDRVDTGEIIAVLGSDADPQDVERAARWIEENEHSAVRKAPDRPPPEGLQLGRLSGDWSEVIRSFDRLKALGESDLPGRQIAAALASAMTHMEVEAPLHAKLDRASEIVEAEQKQLAGWAELRDRGVISQRGFERRQHALLAARGDRSAIEVEIAQAKAAGAQLRSDALGLRQSHQAAIGEAGMQLDVAISSASAAIANWQADHIIRAPGSGQIRFFSIWSNGQTLSSGDEFADILPASYRLRAVGYATPENLGKLKLGQDVLLSLESHSSVDFGEIKGKLVFVSPVIHNGLYRLAIDLPNGLRTTNGHNLPLTQNMPALGKIRVAESSMLGRLFAQFNRLARSE